MTIIAPAALHRGKLASEEPVLPKLRKGQVVVIENASIRKSVNTRKLLEKAGCSGWFLPPYSLDVNAMEKLSAHLTRRSASTRKHLVR